MTVYDWNRDWVFFNEYPKANFKIKDLSEMLDKIGFKYIDKK